MPPLLVLRYRLEYFALRLIVGFCRLFPLDSAADFTARLIKRLASGGRRHKKALANLEIAFPEKSPEEREAIALAMWDNIGRVIVETMQIDRLLDQPERIEVEDNVYRRYKGKMGTVVAVSLHMGNWEIAAWPLILCDSKMAGVYRLVKNPYVDQYLRKMRSRLYSGGMFAKGRARGKSAGFDTVRAISGHIRDVLKNETATVGFLADLYDGKGIEVPFFGQQARSTPFPAMLARRLGARMWIGRCIRVPGQSRFRVAFREVKVPRTDDSEADVRNMTAEIQQQFEEWIRENPEQYMWTNRRFA
jgi:KDO2-lipid IV(A) lauroyltransferase